MFPRPPLPLASRDSRTQAEASGDGRAFTTLAFLRECVENAITLRCDQVVFHSQLASYSRDSFDVSVGSLREGSAHALGQGNVGSSSSYSSCETTYVDAFDYAVLRYS